MGPFTLAVSADAIASAFYARPTTADRNLIVNRIKHWVRGRCLAGNQPGRGRAQMLSFDSILLAGVLNRLAEIGVPVCRYLDIREQIAANSHWRDATAGVPINLLVSLQTDRTIVVLHPRALGPAADLPEPYITINLTSILTAVGHSLSNHGGAPDASNSK